MKIGYIFRFNKIVFVIKRDIRNIPFLTNVSIEKSGFMCVVIWTLFVRMEGKRSKSHSLDRNESRFKYTHTYTNKHTQ